MTDKLFPVLENCFPDRNLIFPDNFLTEIEETLIKIGSYLGDTADFGSKSPKIPVFSLLNREICRDRFA